MFRSPLADGIILLLIVILFFGPKRLPMLSRSIGESIKEFKGGISHDDKQIDASQANQTTQTTESTDKREPVA
jgi:sec-independent protein translocase protein TatA